MSSNALRTYLNLVWAEVRRRYLAGETGPALCAEFGLSRSTLVARARKGKWRRRDFETPGGAPAAAPSDPRAAALEAVARAALASAAGDHAKAEAGARLAERFLKTAGLLERKGGLDLPCPHCRRRPSETREDRAKYNQDVWDEINRRLDRLHADAVERGEIPPDDICDDEDDDELDDDDDGEEEYE